MAGKISVAQLMEILRAETREASVPRKLDVWVCECCALILNTGDDSSCRDYYGHTHPSCDLSVVRVDSNNFRKTGYYDENCDGCGELIFGTLYAATRLTNN